MTPEQKALFDGLTTLQQEISLNSLSGMNDIDSYKASRGKAKTIKTMEASVSEILSNPKVVSFIDAMKEVAVNNAIMSRERMMEIQTKLAEMDISSTGDISLGSLAEYKAAFDIKLKAMKQLSELAGYDAASKIDHSSSDGSMATKGKTLDDFYNESKE